MKERDKIRQERRCAPMGGRWAVLALVLAGLVLTPHLPSAGGLFGANPPGTDRPRALVPGAGGRLLAAPNPFEQDQIEAQVLEAFRVIVALWREELYFELYDLGSQATQGRVSREEFAQRMVELAYVPQGELNPKHLKSQMRYRTMAYVKARIKYRHKFNSDRTFDRDHSFLMLEEEGAWRVDLIQLVRAPYTR